MTEVIGTFSSTEAWQEGTNRSPKTRNGSPGCLAQKRLELAEGHLDGIEVRRILGQVAKGRPCLRNRLTYARTFVSADIVHHDDIAPFEGRNQALLDIGQEHLCVHGALEHHRGDHFIMTQGCHEGDRLPFSAGGAPDQLDASRTATPKSHHLGGDRGLVNKHQPGRIKHTLLSEPTSARPGHVGAVLFCRSQTLFFLKVMPCRWKNRETALLLVRIRRLSSSAMISSNVRSGCWATRANICSACFSNGETLPPRGFDAQLPLSIQRCSHRTAELGSISKFSAASRREAPDFTASITRLRKSAE